MGDVLTGATRDRDAASTGVDRAEVEQLCALAEEHDAKATRALIAENARLRSVVQTLADFDQIVEDGLPCFLCSANDGHPCSGSEHEEDCPIRTAKSLLEELAERGPSAPGTTPGASPERRGPLSTATPAPVPPPPATEQASDRVSTDRHGRRCCAIIGGATGLVIGCTHGEVGKEQVLAEEPRASFREIDERDCSICQCQGDPPSSGAPPIAPEAAGAELHGGGSTAGKTAEQIATEMVFAGAPNEDGEGSWFATLCEPWWWPDIYGSSDPIVVVPLQVEQSSLATETVVADARGIIARLVERVRAERADLSTSTGDGTMWPVREILRELADAADHLLHEHDCDAHGYENVMAARDAARKILAHGAPDRGERGSDDGGVIARSQSPSRPGDPFHVNEVAAHPTLMGLAGGGVRGDGEST